MTPLTHTDLYLCLFQTHKRGWHQLGEPDMLDAQSEAVEHVRDILEGDMRRKEIVGVYVRMSPSDAMHRDVTEDILSQVAEWLPDHPIFEKEAA